MSLGTGVRLGAEIPVARVAAVAGPQFREVVHLKYMARRNVKSTRAPHIESGQVLKASQRIDGSLWSWSTYVDTSAGGFTSDEVLYFAWLEDHPLPSASGFASRLSALRSESGLSEPEFMSCVLGPFVAVQKPTPSSFRLEVRCAAPNYALFEKLAVAYTNEPLDLPVGIRWIGIEPA